MAKTKKKLRKSISLIEIVAALALVAVVGTVGVLVYKNHFKKQVPQTDKEIINQLNQSVSKNFGDKKDLDLTDVVDAFERDGITMSKLGLSDKNCQIIYDSDKCLFGVYENKVGVTYPVDIERKASEVTPSLWKFTNVNPSAVLEHFSYYLFDGCAGEITAVGGIDVGKNDDISKITYLNTTPDKQNVLFKTNSYETELIISELVGDQISHYGHLGKLTVVRLHTDSYHEFGETKFATIPLGRVVIENTGHIDVAYVSGSVAFLQIQGAGTIGKAFASTSSVQAASKVPDEKYGLKVQLLYDYSISNYEQYVYNLGNDAMNDAIVQERIEKGLEKHPNAIGYIKEGSAITIFDSVKDAVDYVTPGSSATINITNGSSEYENIVIADKNITFRGNEKAMPNIRGNIEIKHTSGSHEVKFENVTLVSKEATKDTVVDYSICTNKNNTNTLTFEHCRFSYAGNPTSKAAIALAPVDTRIGTELVVSNSEFYITSSSQVAITTRSLYGSKDSINRGETILSYKQHRIENNTFNCTGVSKNPGISVNFATISGNTFNNLHTVFSFVPTVISSTNCQFDVYVGNNIFNNITYLFTAYDFDSCYTSSDFKLNFYDAHSNYFSNVKNLGIFDSATTSQYVQATFSNWINSSNSWSGIQNPSVGVTLDRVTMNISGTPYFDHFTLPNGDRIQTYTQIDGSENPRTGYIVYDNSWNRYFYYATFNNEVNIFLQEGTNNAYMSLLKDGEIESLRVKEINEKINWFDESIFEEETYKQLKYYDFATSDKVGALIKLDDAFTTLLGNTYLNCEIEQTNSIIKVNKLPVDPEDPEAVQIPAEVYVSDIGEHEKLVITNEEPAISKPDELVIVVPTSDVTIVLSGKFDAELKGSIPNLILRNRLDFDVVEGSSVTKYMEISGENAANLALTNRGYISKLVVNSKANINNYSEIDELVTGLVGEKHIEETLSDASGVAIYNSGVLEKVTLYAKTELLNNKAGYIEDLTVTYISGYESLCAGSSIINDGQMCAGEGNIRLYVECRLMNLSTSLIGTEYRSTAGGCIIIGDNGDSDAHDGVVVINTGLIWAGQDEDGNTRTFIVNGVKNGAGENVPQITLTSTNIIAGTSSDEEIVFVNEFDIAPVIEKNL